MRGLFKTTVAAALPLILGAGVLRSPGATVPGPLAPLSTAALEAAASSRTDAFDPSLTIKYFVSHPIDNPSTWNTLNSGLMPFDSTATPDVSDPTSVHPQINEVPTPSALTAAAPTLVLILTLTRLSRPRDHESTDFSSRKRSR